MYNPLRGYWVNHELTNCFLPRRQKGTKNHEVFLFLKWRLPLRGIVGLPHPYFLFLLSYFLFKLATKAVRHKESRSFFVIQLKIFFAPLCFQERGWGWGFFFMRKWNFYFLNTTFTFIILPRDFGACYSIFYILPFGDFTIPP